MTSAVWNLMSTILKKSALNSSKKSGPMVNSVRFRKPRWLPIAKSKEFYVRKPTPIIPEEAEELYMRYSKYRADVASIRLFLKDQLSQKDVNLSEQQEKDDAADLKLMAEQVEEWNGRIAQSRPLRQEVEAQAERERLEKVMQKLQEDRLKRALQAERNLTMNKTTDFIQPENLDEAIEVMLDSRSDYNYAVTKSGELMHGEFPEQTPSAEPSRTKMSDWSS